MRDLLKNKLVSGSLVLFAGSTVANFGNYLFHLLMGRFLGPGDYGVLVSLLSVSYLVSVFSATINTVVVKHVSVYRSGKQLSHVFSMLENFTRVMAVLGLLTTFLFLVSSGYLTGFLKTGNRLALGLISTTFLLRFLAPINNGIIRSFLNFKFLSINSALAVVIKLSLGVVLVKSGFSVVGAVLAIVLADYLTYLLSFWPLRFLVKFREKVNNKGYQWRDKISYAWPSFLAIFSLTSLYSTDVILVKHYFDPAQAGYYSALGMLGKIIFFASSSITLVMFPLTAERFEKGKDYQKILKQALLAVGVISLAITLVYFWLPELMIRLLYGPSYLAVAPILGYFGVFIAIYSLISTLGNFFLAIGRTNVWRVLGLGAIGQPLLIILFHQTLLQVIRVSISVSGALFLALLVYNQMVKRSGLFLKK